MTSKFTPDEVVLAVNAGSSSVKAALIKKDHTHLASFVAERLSSEHAVLHCNFQGDNKSFDIPNGDHEQALKKIFAFLKEHDLLDKVVATGHRVVHGGKKFTKSTLVDNHVLDDIEAVSHLAPLHNPHNVKGIKAIQKALPSVPAIAVFDTSFHTTLPQKAKTYPIPGKYREKGIQKYGFHGTSVRYVVDKATDLLSDLKEKKTYNLIVCHLGNGASVTGVAGGKSVETSMGFSPLAGLMMGTRSGDIDPAVVSFAMHTLGLTVDEVLDDFNKESGLKAMVDTDPDMRNILKQAHEDNNAAKLAVDMFSYRVVQNIASCLVALPGSVDAIVFTGGIGEHSSEIRKYVAESLQRTILPGFVLDSDLNDNDGEESKGVLTAEGAFPICLAMATDEEAQIAKDSFFIASQE